MAKKRTFDYLIIGGGSAGSVLANRLTENGQHQVCLLEAGPRDINPFIRMPLGIVLALRNKTINWQFYTTSQPNCADRKIYWPRGRVLGGSSAINAMCYVLGNPKDYDAWAAEGNEGWSYEDVLPYFKKNAVSVSSARELNPLMSVFLKAGQEAGYAYMTDFNQSFQEGVGLYEVTQEKGRRCSNAHAYLSPIKKRQNLTVITKAHVCQILFDGKRAIGVRYKQGRHEKEIFVKKEVILSAGAIGSPHLLLLSGVGPRKELEKHGIPLVHDLPGVGENLQDHLDIHITCLEKTRLAISFHFTALWRFVWDGCRYFVNRRGCLTSNYTQAGGFLKTNDALSAPNLQWHFAPSVFTNSARELKNFFKHFGYTLMTCLLTPKSRGRLYLKNSDPKTPPIIDPHYLSDPTDLEEMLIGFKKARYLLSQPAFKENFFSELEPGANVETDEQIKAYIRERAETVYHPVGTCKMGQDAMSVVSPISLKVHGLVNVRVIDASVMPTITRGNTNAPTTMIAEKGAAMIFMDST